jgi:energy-coupling factor transporter ATP-binding protein EcfA2
MQKKHQFTKVEFHKFKAFDSFVLHIRPFNILVGPNNAGKSTIIAAFRILSAALRKAYSRRQELIQGPMGPTRGYQIDLASISIAEENIFYNYDDNEAAHIKFTLSNKNELLLYFPEQGSCSLIARTFSGRLADTTTAFKSNFNCKIGFVPILGPVEHNEPLYAEDAARRALFSYQAARNFRNIWHHYPEKFDAFQKALRATWPGMDVARPEVDLSHQKPLLRMFCPEGRNPREIFWAGFGFQVWCQMLTHLIQSGETSLFLIDEPDIYLHSDLQRQLLGLLRNLGPDILIATHSTEIISEAEPDDIVLVNKRHRIARRIKHPSQLTEVFGSLGSNLNPILTQLAKTRRVVFVEGKDFQIIGRFAEKCGMNSVASRANFAVVPSEGFNPERVKSLKEGMEFTLGSKIKAAVIFDRDYRCSEEAEAIAEECGRFGDFANVHGCKEIENFLLVPAAIDRAAANKLADRRRRTGLTLEYSPTAEAVLEAFATEKRAYVASQVLAKRREYIKGVSPKLDEATVNEIGFADFERRWANCSERFAMIPGKDALAKINEVLQTKFGISVTPTLIIDAMAAEEVPGEIRVLLERLAEFSAVKFKD